MADIVTNTLQIGSNNLILRDADAQEQLVTVKDGLEDLEEIISQLGGLSEGVKQALLQIAEKVAYIDEDGQDYYDDLYDALYPPADLVSISAVYTQSGTVYDTDSLDSLKSDLVVTAHMSDSTTRTVTDYVLSGTLTEGTSTITVSYSGKTTTFTVTVSRVDNSIYNWDFTQSLVDSKQGVTAVLGEGSTQSSVGVTINGSYVQLVDLSAYKSTAFTVEMDVTAVTQASNSNTVVLGLGTTGEGSAVNNGVKIRTNGDWAFIDGSNNWKYPSPTISGADYFNNSTLKFVANFSGKTWSLYKDGELVTSYSNVYATSNNRDNLTIGSSKSNCYLGSGTIIRALRVYAGVA